jgi:hypothetical protein
MALVVPGVAVSATVAGKVTFDGTPPPPKVLQVTKDADKCGPEQILDALVVDASKGVQDVVVSTVNAPADKRDKDEKGGKKDEKAHDKVALDQQKCRFTPHVLLVPAGAELIVQNSDGIAHNLHTFALRITACR